ncbi:receptor-interacting serine/threonine-protein kinase 1 [Paramormyrops kingsleyae]|uniref:receptor-interacting serine/threonine-protein kinase 1 n=1 Tax=Paramormyrops kingsleyae TaxID=1676925 RepID=UPI003B96A23B
MAVASESICMTSADLIKKAPLDFGCFGQVYLCYHKTHGQVVQKTVYTGYPPNDKYKKSLMEEGRILHKLNHKRIVKLLGLIMEDGAYSLVMEFISRGNLLAMLDRVDVPVSIKGRIILDILDGMVYLSQNDIIHKDLKPDNILVDEDFHIKIADLGLATCQSWSKLTKEESRNKSRLGQRTCGTTAGTLSYMAPEHLMSIHARSSEKSDVYSFAIVVWVVLTRKQPYENALNEDQVCACVRLGNRPDENLIPQSTPAEMVTLMKNCWQQNPEQRPTFTESYESFKKFYKNGLEKNVEKDIPQLMAKYKGPEDFLEKMKSLSLDSFNLQGDCPTSLKSSDMPVEASIEDLHAIANAEQLYQGDAMPVSNLEVKLEQEFNYHKHGSYNYPDRPDAGPPRPSVEIGREDRREVPWRARPPLHVSTVQSWTKNDPHSGGTVENFSSFSNQSTPSPSVVAPPMGSPDWSPLYQYAPQHEQAQLHSIPIPESESPDSSTGYKSVFLSNAKGVQIGDNNRLFIGCQDFSLPSLPSNGSNSMYQELLLKFEDCPVTEEHLEMLRQNIGINWRQCVRRLGLTDVEVETIEHDYVREGLNEMVYQALGRWKMKEGYVGCTMGKLCRALQGVVKAELLHKLLEICRSPQSP